MVDAIADHVQCAATQSVLIPLPAPVVWLNLLKFLMFGLREASPALAITSWTAGSASSSSRVGSSFLDHAPRAH